MIKLYRVDEQAVCAPCLRHLEVKSPLLITDSSGLKCALCAEEKAKQNQALKQHKETSAF